ncbi:hypothetical protein ACULLL_18820 [Lysinibacillus irui]|uniref:hypothetical protein n=1 Tax=Lysinibacillus irui TaxID=2998077 RepID=UPI004044E9DC
MKDLIKEIYECTDCAHKSGCNKVYYGQRFKPHIAIILQNPGPPAKGYKQEENKKLSIMSHEEKAAYHSGELKKWLLGSYNKEFFLKFFSLLGLFNLIQIQIKSHAELMNYINSGDIYNDIYFTDGLKCRGRTSDFKPEHYKYCFSKYTKREISRLPNLKLIFVFSTRTWDSFYNEFSPVQIQEFNTESMKVTQVHGLVFKTNIKMEGDNSDKKVHVIPLVHMSPNTRNNTLRNTYFEFLNEGLKYYDRIKLDGNI